MFVNPNLTAYRKMYKELGHTVVIVIPHIINTLKLTLVV